MFCSDPMNGSHFIAQTSKFLLIDATAVTLGQGHGKVIQYIFPDPYILCAKYLRFWCERQKLLRRRMRQQQRKRTENIKSPQTGVTYYNMTVWILARKEINFSMAAGLIRLHMPGVK